ncbi:MAG TPA: NAD-binding protein [Planctomycetota bacterium]
MPGEPTFEYRFLRRDVAIVAGLGFSVVLVGTLGYWALHPEWGLLRSLYMTVITVTTVGYGEVGELGSSGRVFTIFLIVAGVTTGYFAAGVLGRAVLASYPRRTRKRMEKIIESMSGHVILCGYGRLGQTVRHELEAAGREFVVIDIDPVAVEMLLDHRVPALRGDAAHEEILVQAGVERAFGVIACVSSDSDNVFITLTAREKNPRCSIVARAESPQSAPRLRRVGADKVVTPYDVGGKLLAQALMRPSTVGLAELALGAAGHEVLIEEVQLPDPLPENFATLAGLELGARHGLIAVGVRGVDGTLRFNPRAGARLSPGEFLLVMGEKEGIDLFFAALGTRRGAGRR